MGYFHDGANGPTVAQPPAGTLPSPKGIGKGLLLGASDPRYVLWHRATGWNKLVQAEGTRAFAKSTRFGNMLSFNGANPVYAPNTLRLPTIGATGMTIMVAFRVRTPTTTEGTLMSFGGFGNTMRGWNLQADVSLDVNSDTASVFPGVPQAIAADKDYVVVYVQDGNLTTSDCFFYYGHRDVINERRLVTTLADLTLAMQTPLRGMSLGGSMNDAGGVYTHKFVGDIGPYALWDRRLSEEEINALLYNPYEPWNDYQNGSRFISTSTPVNTTFTSPSGMTGSLGTPTVTGLANVPVTGLVGTTSLGTTAIHNNISPAVTGLAGTTSLGTTTVSAKATAPVTGLLATTSLGIPSAGSTIIATVGGLQATTALGTLATVKGGAKATLSGFAMSFGFGVLESVIAGNRPLEAAGMVGSVGRVAVAGWSQVVNAQGPSWVTIVGKNT